MDENKSKSATEPVDDQLNSGSTATGVTKDMPAPIKEKISIKGLLRKPVALACLLVLVIGGIVGAAYLATSGDDESVAVNSETTQGPEVAQVQQLAAAIALTEGTVQYSSDGGKTWADSSGGETVGELDYVRTVGASRAVVLLDDGSAVRLDSETTMYLAVSNTNQVEVMLTEGQVYSRVSESETREFSVTTANESFVAKGTAYKTSTNSTADSLEVYQSSVEVKSDGVDVEEGNKYDTTDKTKEALDLEALETDDFVQWNKGKDLENENNKERLGVLGGEEKQEVAPAPTPQPSTNPGSSSARINLNGSATGSGLSFNWSLENTNSTDGFKLVRAKNDSTPSYGQDTAVYIGSGSSRSYNLDLKDGGTYYFRVCIYRSGGTCDTYSNAVQVTAPFVQKDPVVSGAINLTISGNQISWSLAGGNAPYGYKVVLGTAQNPTYPENSIKYTSDTSMTLNPENGAGTYYVRVCKYTDGTQSLGCVDYSNQVTYVVAE